MSLTQCHFQTLAVRRITRMQKYVKDLMTYIRKEKLFWLDAYPRVDLPCRPVLFFWPRSPPGFSFPNSRMQNTDNSTIFRNYRT